MRSVFALRGVSGSGKTTAALELAQGGDVIIDHDEYMVDELGRFHFDPGQVDACHRKCREAFRDAIDRGVSRIFIAMCLTSEGNLRWYQQEALESGYQFISLVVEHRHERTNVHGTPPCELDAQETRLRASLILSSLRQN